MSAYTATSNLIAADVEDMKLAFPPPMTYQYCRPEADDTIMQGVHPSLTVIEWCFVLCEEPDEAGYYSLEPQDGY
ncbi:hypothetical protein Dimus_005511, partial [Dionaea muscipula]